MIQQVLITRPLEKGRELAVMLEELDLKAIVQPAFNYKALDLRENQPDDLAKLQSDAATSLLVFTSPRSVQFGLQQLAPEVLWRATIAAIGPATARALSDAGVQVGVKPKRGYTSEDLLDALDDRSTSPSQAFIVAAPGGRKKLADGLWQRCDEVSMLMAYQAESAPLQASALESLAVAEYLLVVWTSANAMKSLSQRMPPATWFQVCQAPWLVISERLLRLARAYGPSDVHLTSGPGNKDIVQSIRALL